jgi:hypothetical protein
MYIKKLTPKNNLQLILIRLIYFLSNIVSLPKFRNLQKLNLSTFGLKASFLIAFFLFCNVTTTQTTTNFNSFGTFTVSGGITRVLGESWGGGVQSNGSSGFTLGSGSESSNIKYEERITPS